MYAGAQYIDPPHDASDWLSWSGSVMRIGEIDGEMVAVRRNGEKENRIVPRSVTTELLSHIHYPYICLPHYLKHWYEHQTL